METQHKDEGGEEGETKEKTREKGGKGWQEEETTVQHQTATGT